MKSLVSKLFKKPTYSFSELPDAIQSEVSKVLITSGFCLVFGIICAIRSLSILLLVYILAGVGICFCLFFLFWYRFFIFDKVLYYEGEIISIEQPQDNYIKKKVQRIVDFTRKTYKLQLENGLIVSVVKGKKNKCRLHMKLRIYVLPEAIIERQDNSYLINNVLFTEIIK